ncbi:alpha/beta hydrolase [Nonomuraea sp. NPDC049607]|uniref:alpha/beta hydrolase n=1 Tax=Nonomuraea sp. NPDC049607 TaxID=3154732 RepID=UPI00343E5E30
MGFDGGLGDVQAGGDLLVGQALAALTGSRMITLNGAFRHGVYLAAGNACVDTKVAGYLADGVLPGEDVTCGRPAV